MQNSGAHFLRRSIPDSDHADAMHCYPLLMCSDWARLTADLATLSRDLVSVSAVTDPFGTYDEALLRAAFPDVTYAYKDHFVVDLTQSSRDFISAHHRRYARKARQSLTVSLCEQPLEYLDTWARLYANLIERHAITGITRFSRASFAAQLQVPGMVMMRAEHHNQTVGLVLWYRHPDRAYYHLAAYTEEGYRLRASFALFDFAIEYFTASGLQWLSLGAGAGVKGDADDGLSRFKRGWSTSSRTAYFCGRIFDQDHYAQLIRQKQIPSSRFFPLYRAST